MNEPWGLRVRPLLNENFPNRWIGRDEPHAWPPRSPDLTPLDFLLWGYVRDRVYATPVRDINHLREKISKNMARTEETINVSFRKKMEIILNFKLNVNKHNKFTPVMCNIVRV